MGPGRCPSGKAVLPCSLCPHKGPRPFEECPECLFLKPPRLGSLRGVCHQRYIELEEMGGQGWSHSLTVGQGLIPACSWIKMFCPPTPPALNTAGYKEPGKAHSITNRFGESDRTEEEGFWHR